MRQRIRFHNTPCLLGTMEHEIDRGARGVQSGAQDKTLLPKLYKTDLQPVPPTELGDVRSSSAANAASHPPARSTPCA